MASQLLVGRVLLAGPSCGGCTCTLVPAACSCLCPPSPPAAGSSHCCATVTTTTDPDGGRGAAKCGQGKPARAAAAAAVIGSRLSSNNVFSPIAAACRACVAKRIHADKLDGNTQYNNTPSITVVREQMQVPLQFEIYIYLFLLFFCLLIHSPFICSKLKSLSNTLIVPRTPEKSLAVRHTSEINYNS